MQPNDPVMGQLLLDELRRVAELLARTNELLERNNELLAGGARIAPPDGASGTSDRQAPLDAAEITDVDQRRDATGFTTIVAITADGRTAQLGAVSSFGPRVDPQALRSRTVADARRYVQGWPASALEG